MSKGMVLCRLLLMLSVAISGCGYSGDHALDYHQQDKVTESKLDVVKGSVYSVTGRAVSLSFNDLSFETLTQQQRKNFDVLADFPFALHQFGFLDDDDNFYFQGTAANAILSATFDGYTLYSFYQGIPIPKTDVTITQDHNWHGSNKLTLHVSKDSPSATISINPFSNLAYWLGGGPNGTYATYTKARVKIDDELGFSPVLPGCWFEVNLCNDHLNFFKAGNTISANSEQFTITRGTTVCSGNFKNYTGTMKLCPP